MLDKSHINFFFSHRRLVLSAASEAIASPTAKINQISFRSIHVVGEATALSLRSTPTGSFIFFS
jgi:hypothetical protein